MTTKTTDHPAAWLEKRNSILIQLILDCGFGELPVEQAVEKIRQIVRHYHDNV